MKVGDMFMIVRPTPCCGSEVGLGRIHTIAGFWRGLGKAGCVLCGRLDDAKQMAVLYEDDGETWGIERDRIRILPPDIEVAETDRAEVA